MLVNKTVEFFLSEAAGWTGCRRGTGSGQGAARGRTRYRRGPRPGLGQDTGGDRGLGRDKMPARAEAWAGTRCRRGPRLSRQRARSGQGPDGMPARAEAGTRCRRGPRLSRQRANQLKRKRSIISSSNSGFSKSFSLVIIKLLCSKNPASW